MESEGYFRHTQEPAICPYPEPDQSSPSPPPLASRRSSLILSSYLGLGLPSNLFPSGFPTKTLFASLLSPMRDTCPALLILDFITRTVLGEEYRSLTLNLLAPTTVGARINP